MEYVFFLSNIFLFSLLLVNEEVYSLSLSLSQFFVNIWKRFHHFWLTWATDDGHSVTRCWEQKVAQLFPKVTKY